MPDSPRASSKDTLVYAAPGQSFMAQEIAGIVAPREAYVVLIPIPLEATVTFGSGTAKGPDAIIAASASLESYDDELGFDILMERGIATLKMQKLSKSLSAALDQVAIAVDGVLRAGKLPVVVGGEHSLTAGAIRPFAKLYDELIVLHFDAHMDLRDSYRGEAFSHASAMARVLDHKNIKLVSVGVRSISQIENEQIASEPDRIYVHWARKKACWDINEIIKPLVGRPIYVSFDVDVFDASLMPATGTPEPGGLFFDEICSILKAATRTGHIVGADIVELAPISGVAACDITAAKLTYKLISYALCPNGKNS